MKYEIILNSVSYILLRIVFIFFFLFSFVWVKGQHKIDTAAVVKELAFIHERDQKTRKHGDSAQYIRMIDSSNLIMIEALIKSYGWPGKSFVGSRGNSTVFLVVQHADLTVQEKYLPLLIQSVADSQSRPSDLALLQDRILMRTGKKQLYGSQVVPNKSTGAWEFYPIEDEKNVNKRRAAMGLHPIEEDAKFFGIEYTLPVGGNTKE